GDGDHGRGMVRGVGAALESARSALDAGASARAVLTAAGGAWADRAGGTSGVLWGAMLRTLARELELPLTARGLAAAVRSGVGAVEALGGARLGDKTMLDAALPAVDELDRVASLGLEPSEASARVAAVARDAAQRSADLAPRIGRARPLAERSVGTPDPGAVSFALAVATVGAVLASVAEGHSSAVGDTGGTHSSTSEHASEERQP